MRQISHSDQNEPSLLTASPMVQRFMLGIAVGLAGYHGVGTLRSGIGARAGRTEPGSLERSGEKNRPLLAVDINRASAEELALLPGIGPVAATAIVESRDADGPFLAVADLERVHGIGPKTVDAVRPYLLRLSEDDEKLPRWFRLKAE